MLTDPGPNSAESEAHASAWQLLRALARDARADLPDGLVVVGPNGAWTAAPSAPETTRQMLELCLPLCRGEQRDAFVYAHLGQSLDGQIATATGASRYVTCSENLTHMHRLRALADAVVVGAGTVECDDPELTTRHVPGDSPVRVVLDPGRRLRADRRVFRDGRARTLVVSRAGAKKPRGFSADVEVVEVASPTPELRPAAIVAALAERGLRRLFIEGGGITVSRFLAARMLDRLHVTVCPVFIGRGRPGVVLPGVDRMEQTLRPAARRFLLGEDVLFDCAFERGSNGAAQRARTP